MRRRTELPSAHSKGFNEAVSRMFNERASFELREDDIELLRKQFAASSLRGSAGHTAPCSSSASKEVEEYRDWKMKHPGLLENFAHFKRLANGKRLTVFLDYDGTLTPIVKNPDRAFMSDQMREAVRMVARLFPTAIISGRGREKVEGFVKLKELYYAGSHGMDIVGPQTEGLGAENAFAFQPAARFEPIMDQVFEDLTSRVADIPGATVEHNKFCVSVHFRNCQPEQLDDVVAAVEAILDAHADLRATRGRKVLEIRPQVDWDKGAALAHLLQALQLDDGTDVLPIYIGDDRTDEDAFEVLRKRALGFGILVSTKVKPTAATYTLRDPTEVMSFLGQLVAWGRTDANAWHRSASCSGWDLNPDTCSPANATTDGPLQPLDTLPEASGRSTSAPPSHYVVRDGRDGTAEAVGDSGDDAPMPRRSISTGRPPLHPDISLSDIPEFTSVSFGIQNGYGHAHALPRHTVNAVVLGEREPPAASLYASFGRGLPSPFDAPLRGADEPEGWEPADE